MEDRTIRTVSGYGTELRGRLEELDLTQAWLAREASLSRQTVSRAINRDEFSDLTRAKIEEALCRWRRSWRPCAWRSPLRGLGHQGGPSDPGRHPLQRDGLGTVVGSA